MLMLNASGIIITALIKILSESLPELRGIRGMDTKGVSTSESRIMLLTRCLINHVVLPGIHTTPSKYKSLEQSIYLKTLINTNTDQEHVSI